MISYPVTADPYYIRDTLYVPLRAQPAEDADFIEKALPSGTEVTIVDASPINGYVLTRLADGTEGYILLQYLIDQPIARERLESLRSEQDTLRLELDSLRSELEQARLNQAEQRSELNKAEQLATDHLDSLKLAGDENSLLSAELERMTQLSQPGQEREDKYAALQEQFENLTREMTQVQTEDDQSNTEQQQQWFMIGAGTILFGILLGFWMARKLYQGKITGSWS
ncbi:MAG: TIGR04211 family SH3 domain-containing protein [Gammaproteobacteria bacterium]|nr:TIGR04211 family SH3 domain-containing protein [Gammaproteobacteria bacterium]MBT5205301.1 TIGR04211 family SH3 domain-containing protein [Gammaproteobacteria bacterium]MBT5603760.1 TIGR04211 family SH3 domain-containing protein [Gammaproteobacteria bacterium]